MSGPEPLVRIDDLVKTFPVGKSWGRHERLRAIDGVSLTIDRGQTLGLVGESGSGKTTLGRCLVRLTTPDTGRVTFDGTDVLALNAGALRRFRRRIQVVFQDPVGSLNPRMTVGRAVREPMEIHRLGEPAQREERVGALLREVGLDPSFGARYPHELSGGQRQRVGVARALAVEPEFLILDEPVSALDVSVQSQVLHLLRALQRARGLTYLFIAHDLAVVRQIADRVAVMYLGRIVEERVADQLFASPRHPYTAALLSAVPHPDPGAQPTRTVLSGDAPSALHRPAGCVFHPRCPHWRKDDRCETEIPVLRAVDEGVTACHYGEEMQTGQEGQ